MVSFSSKSSCRLFLPPLTYRTLIYRGPEPRYCALQMFWVWICGTRPLRSTLGTGSTCPVCGEPTVSLVEDSARACFCFVPLCIVGSPTQSSVCTSCGARMPLEIALRGPAGAQLVTRAVANDAATAQSEVASPNLSPLPVRRSLWSRTRPATTTSMLPCPPH